MRQDNLNFYEATKWILIYVIAAAAIAWISSCTVNRYYVVVQPIKERIIEKQTYPIWNDWGISQSPMITITPSTAPNPFTLEHEWDGSEFDLSIEPDEFILIEYDSTIHRPISPNLIPR